MSSIKSEIKKGVFWTAVAKYSGLAISLVVTAILARNISPSAFGTMAIAGVITAFLELFVNMGFGTAIVQFKNLTERQINSLFLVGGLLGITLSAILFFSASLIAEYYHDNDLTIICRLLCLCMLFNALNVVPNGLMMKHKRFKTVAIRTLSFQILSGIASVWGALNGWGIYALIISPIITAVGVFCFNFYNYPQRFFINMDWSAIRTVWSYSSFQFLSYFSNYFSRNLDKLIIGKYFSMAQLGYYEKSYRLMQLPLQNITFVISPVLHPILSSLQDQKQELGAKNLKLTKFLSELSFPIGIALYFCAYEVVMILFGKDWAASVPVFQILALSLPLQMILSTSGAIYQAAGKTNHMFYVGLCNTIVTVLGFLIAAIWFKTIEAMAWAWNITLLINFIDSYMVMNCRTLGFPAIKFFQSLIPQIINSTITTATAYFIIKLLPVENVFLSLLFKCAVIAVLTLAMGTMLKQYNPSRIVRHMTARMV